MSARHDTLVRRARHPHAHPLRTLVRQTVDIDVTTERYRLPSIDRILADPAAHGLIARYGRTTARDALRAIQEELRALDSVPDWAREPNGYRAALEARLRRDVGPGLVSVFNLTGTLVHTNLGRAPLGEEMIEAAIEAAAGPLALEFDLTAGGRGDRDAHVEPLIRSLTGAEAATVVNNNAAAVVLVLNTLALRRGVPVSRGELIEIGGSFRLPEIMERAGCVIREVGTTNRTHVSDFASAIDDRTALLLKVHPSNYRIEGFASTPSAAELADLAHARNLPLCIDLGSGTLVDLARFGLPHEPTPRELLAQGADLVTFSGDKLLGSVQAGLIAGRAELVAKLKRNPLRRALRPDKVTLAILRRTLIAYTQPETLAERIPLFRMLSTSTAALDAAAQRVAAVLRRKLSDEYVVEVRESRCEIGSGALPQTTLPSRAACVTSVGSSGLQGLHAELRALPTPVLGRLHAGTLWLDVRALLDVDALERNLEQLPGARA